MGSNTGFCISSSAVLACAARLTGRREYFEEWTAELYYLPDSASRLRFALGIAFSAHRIGREVEHEGAVRRRSGKLRGKKSGTRAKQLRKAMSAHVKDRYVPYDSYGLTLASYLSLIRFFAALRVLLLDLSVGVGRAFGLNN